ncbi:hypothetical protein FACS1894190_07180 [Spirochaetia bacterium]|nr:hypothetical protein FACS1894190_07180 [Spirochaetia bacterium]
MFSNATEAEWWQDKNCHKCWKYNSVGEDRNKIRCKTGYDIDLGYITGSLPNRVKKITEEINCPYRQDKRPPKRKKARPMPLFES